MPLQDAQAIGWRVAKGRSTAVRAACGHSTGARSSASSRRASVQCSGGAVSGDSATLRAATWPFPGPSSLPAPCRSSRNVPGGCARLEGSLPHSSAPLDTFAPLSGSWKLPEKVLWHQMGSQAAPRGPRSLPGPASGHISHGRTLWAPKAYTPYNAAVAASATGPALPVWTTWNEMCFNQVQIELQVRFSRMHVQRLLLQVGMCCALLHACAAPAAGARTAPYACC